MKTDGKELIRKAFEMAKARKPDWYRMTTAVLKNRLLVLTNNEFKEEEYGARTILEFVEQAADIVNIDRSVIPPIVELKGERGEKAHEARQAAATYSVSFDRIRPDLWQAIMDYTSGNKYVWDARAGTARPQNRDDPPEVVLPTITQEEEMKWRKEFAASVAALPLDDIAKFRLNAFGAKNVSPKVLTLGLQWKWNDFVRAKIIKAVTDWFQQHKLSQPEHLTVQVRRAPRPPAEPGVEELRDLIIAVIRGMTAAELLAVQLPPNAVLRTRKDKG
jgi:hypothetical protein